METDRFSYGHSNADKSVRADTTSRLIHTSVGLDGPQRRMVKYSYFPIEIQLLSDNQTLNFPLRWSWLVAIGWGVIGTASGGLWFHVEYTQGIAYRFYFPAATMIDEATLATMLSAFLWLVYHCREWKKERGQFSEWMDNRMVLIGQMGHDLQEVLEDIADGIGSAPSPVGGTQPPSGIGEILTALFMSSMNMPSKHGESEVGPVQEEVSEQTQTETENEPN